VSLFTSLKSLFSSSKKDKSNLPRIEVNKRFELLGRTGQGSMSKVWRVRDRLTQRIFCLKVLDKVKTIKFEKRFPGLTRPNEGAILLALQHPHIVKTFEHGLTKEGEQYIVMELIEGVGLNFMIETQSSQLKGHRIDILTQLADALDHVHKKGFLHRDICPRNVMVEREGCVKLIDFGLTIPNTPDFCKPGNRTGTSDYLAPEVIKRVVTDQRVDLFALGVTAFEMFTGALPWDKADSMQTLINHMNTPARDPRDVKPDLDPRVAKFLTKAIQRDPKARHQSAAEFREGLRTLPKS
jgi:serine/threonine protein kinase